MNLYGYQFKKLIIKLKMESSAKLYVLSDYLKQFLQKTSQVCLNQLGLKKMMFKFNRLFFCYIFSIEVMIQKADDSALQLRTIEDSSSILHKRPQGRKVTLIGCEKGDFEVAMKHIEGLTSRYQNGQYVPWNVDVQHFKQYGTGVYLFFHFAKRLAILFGIFALISVIPITFNAVAGDAFSQMIKTFGIYYARTTVGNLNPKPDGKSTLDSETSRIYKMENAIPDILMSLAFLAFYLYWEVKSDRLTQNLKGDIRLQCHQSLEVKEFPVGTTEEQIHQFFSQFGKVKEVSTVQNYSELLEQAKYIYDLSQKRKQYLLAIEQEGEAADPEQTKKRQQKAKQCQEKILELENKFGSNYSSQSNCVLKYFVAFEELKARQQALKTLNAYKRCGKCKKQNVPQQHLLGGQLISVTACHNQPGDILWQNLHVSWYSRALRAIVQILLLIVVLAVTFLIISLLNIATPSTSTYLDVSHYDHNSILNVTSSNIIYAWCISYKSQMDTYRQIDTLCTPYINRYYTSLAIGVLISFIVVGVKFVLKKIVVALAKFQRYHGNTQQSIGIMRNLFFTYVCTTTLITLLLQANIFGFSFKKIIQGLVSNSYLQQNGDLLLEFADFVPFWYVDIGYKINITLLIMALQAPLMTPLVLLAKEKFRMWRAKSQLTQRRMQQILMPDAFEIQDHYANTLLILFMALAFSSGMPMILVPCGIALILRYFYYKLVFLRFNLTPPSLDEALNESVINFFPFILAFHFLFGIWMYSTSSVFYHDQSFVSDMIKSNNSFSRSLGKVLMRLGDTWYFTIAFLVCMTVVVLKVIFYDLIYEAYKNRVGDEEIISKKIQIEPVAQEGSVSEKDNMLKSYKIEKNPHYYEILGIMNKLKQKAQ